MSEERNEVYEVRFIFNGCTANAGEWKRQITGLLMGGTVDHLEVASDLLDSYERNALHFKALADEAWKHGIQERAEAFEDAVAYFRPQLIDPSEHTP